MGACFSSQAAPPEGQGAGKDRAPDAGLELGAAPDVRDNNCSSLTSVSNGFASERGSPEEACAQASCSLHPQLSLGQMMKDNRSNSNSSVWDLLSSSQSALDPMHLAGLLPSRRVVEAFNSPSHALGDLNKLLYISRGASCLVFRGVWQSAEVAVKLMVTKGNLSPQSPAVREALLGCELSHPNCVTCYAARCVTLKEGWMQMACMEGASAPASTANIGNNSRSSFDSGDGFGPPPASPVAALLSASLSSTTGQVQLKLPALTEEDPSKSVHGGNTAASADLGAIQMKGLGIAPAKEGAPASPSPSPSKHSAAQQGAAAAADSAASPGQGTAIASGPCRLDPSQLLGSADLCPTGGSRLHGSCMVGGQSPRGTSCDLAGMSSPQLASSGTQLCFPIYSPWAEGCTWAQVLKALKAKPGNVLMVIIQEFCDMGSLSAAVHVRQLFTLRPNPDPGRLPLRALLRTVREVAMGLNHLHEAGVIHGDLKPGNVVLSGSRHDRRGFTAKLTDLGLSRVLAASSPSHARLSKQASSSVLPSNSGNTGNITEPSSTGSLVAQQLVLDADWGTTPYMAPEHFHGVMVKATDIYALGVLIWEMAHGKRPFAGLTHAAIAEGVCSGRLRLVWEAHAPMSLAELCMQCMAHDPTQRPCCPEVIAELAAIETEVREELRRERAMAMMTTADAVLTGRIQGMGRSSDTPRSRSAQQLQLPPGMDLQGGLGSSAGLVGGAAGFAVGGAVGGVPGVIPHVLQQHQLDAISLAPGNAVTAAAAAHAQALCTSGQLAQQQLVAQLKLKGWAAEQQGPTAGGTWQASAGALPPKAPPSSGAQAAWPPGAPAIPQTAGMGQGGPAFQGFPIAAAANAAAGAAATPIRAAVAAAHLRHHYQGSRSLPRTVSAPQEFYRAEVARMAVQSLKAHGPSYHAHGTGSLHGPVPLSPKRHGQGQQPPLGGSPLKQTMSYTSEEPEKSGQREAASPKRQASN